MGNPSVNSCVCSVATLSTKGFFKNPLRQFVFLRFCRKSEKLEFRSSGIRSFGARSVLGPPRFGVTVGVIKCESLLRLVRVCQKVPQFHEAWLLLRGLTDSMRVLFWTCIIIMFITYVFQGLTVPFRSQNQLEEKEMGHGSK